MHFTLEAMRAEDWQDVRAIYQEGMDTGNATFETTAPEWETWDGAHRKDCRLVARWDGRVVAWAALSPVSARRVYAGVTEVSIYVSQPARGRGIGRGLLEALIAASEKAGVWTLQAGIFPENEPSIRLHASCGFREVGRRECLGQRDERWRDVVLMERRSSTVGA